MSIPSFLRPSALETHTGQASALGAGAAEESGDTGFSIIAQEQQNWCWSAVSVSVERFYKPGAVREQCELANTALTRNDCCADGASDVRKCNQPWFLDRALAITGNLMSMESGSLSFDDIRAEIAARTPVGCRIGWHGGGGHFAVIAGWLVAESGTLYVFVEDPIFLRSRVAYDEFPSGYNGGGDWTHNYFTTPAGAGGAVGVAALAEPDLETIGA